MHRRWAGVAHVLSVIIANGPEMLSFYLCIRYVFKNGRWFNDELSAVFHSRQSEGMTIAKTERLNTKHAKITNCPGGAFI
jgi:hypothetical protein